MPAHTIRVAGVDALDDVAALFDAYRVFYRQPSDPERARHFIGERLHRGDSVILLARDSNGPALGFVQLYPSFSSVRTGPIWVLNDLYVDAAARRRGVGRDLLEAARRHGMATGALRLHLSTEESNHAAQRLYESLGWQRDRDRFYVLTLDDGKA